jgi:hypothetical protein
VAASCGYFSFSLQDFAEEMQNYLTILEDLKQETEKTKNRSWKWILFWRKSKAKKASATEDPEQETLIEQTRLPDTSLPSKRIPELVLERRGSVWNGPGDVKNATQDFFRKMLHAFRIVERDECMYNFKKSFPVLTVGSPLCIESRYWSGSLCTFRLHSIYATVLSTLARRMGSLILHVSLQYDDRRL